ncbi:MAG: NAD(P)H-binding protein [Myxococcales bacterium]|nr:NAD(P)H-binding protein [Myxococcales bacterium]
MLPATRRPTVAIAGASGFVGRALIPVLREKADVVALGRSADRPDGPGLTWRRCDLFSLRESEAALEGVDCAYYLVHSMSPNSRLTQARFEDLDLLLADNFGRAAAAQGVKRIIYLGGLLPDEKEVSGDELSAHLASRLETEHALGSHGVPVTAVRAGLVVGNGGSSLHILVRLVEHLPVMVCPAWTSTPSQPIALDDVVRILAHCLDDPETSGRVCDIGGPDVLSYREMMRETARVLQRRRLFIPVPLFSPGLSRLWVSLFTGAPRALVAPLVQSLRHPMVARDRWLQERMGLPGQPFREALVEAIRSDLVPKQPSVRSVQRLPLPPGCDASWLAREYMAWLPRLFRVLLRVETEGPVCRFRWLGVPKPLLELTYRPERSGPTRALFEVTGGLLARKADVGIPRLEFRTGPDGTDAIAALQNFSPRLPWWIYGATQARVHLWVMRAFARHLARVAAAGERAAIQPSAGPAPFA